MGQVAPRSTLTASWPGLCPAGLLTLLEVATSPTIKNDLSGRRKKKKPLDFLIKPVNVQAKRLERDSSLFFQCACQRSSCSTRRLSLQRCALAPPGTDSSLTVPSLFPLFQCLV